MTIESFILIGGRSTRFGSDKFAVQFGGKSLIQRTAETIRNAIEPSKITLVAATNDQFPATVLTTPFPVIFDLHAGRGPIGGFHAALAYARTDWILVLACDLPFISSDLLRHLADQISDEFDAIAPIQPDDRPQPLCALYRVKPCLKIIEQPLINNRSAPPVRAIFDKLRTKFVPFEDIRHLSDSENFFLNMNKPDDFILMNKINDKIRHPAAKRSKAR